MDYNDVRSIVKQSNQVYTYWEREREREREKERERERDRHTETERERVGEQKERKENFKRQLLLILQVWFH